VEVEAELQRALHEAGDGIQPPIYTCTPNYTQLYTIYTCTQNYAQKYVHEHISTRAYQILVHNHTR